jgi:osmoprotectant transport system permease protein
MSGSAEPLIRWGWVGDHLDDIWARTVEHLQLTGIAMGVGSLIALALATIALRYRRTYGPITAIASILYTIPSLALFTLLVSYTGLTRTTAEIGLVSYTLLILVRSIVVGVDGVPDSAREAGIAMGYTRSRLFREVELPLALPTIISGLRVCTVTIVGLVTVTAIIGQGGYGALILDGFRRDFDTPLLIGSLLSVALAVALDLALVGAERALAPWARRGAG